MLMALSTAVGAIAASFVAVEVIGGIKARLQRRMDSLEERETELELRAKKAEVVSEMAKQAGVHNDHLFAIELRLFTSLRAIQVRKKKIDCMYVKLLQKKTKMLAQAALLGATFGGILGAALKASSKKEPLCGEWGVGATT